MNRLSVSLVTFHPNISMLRDTLASLREAVRVACEQGRLDSVDLVLVDNGDDTGLQEIAAQEGWPEIHLVRGQGNVGFGCGHNLAFAQGLGDLHLILNPDVYLQPDALAQAIDFMNAQPECGLLSPSIVGSEEGWHFLCKRFPSVFDLLLRGFAPRCVRHLFRKRLRRYELGDKGTPDVLWDPPIISGCFMLCRSGLLRTLNGFDPRFFLYFEDFDLSLRAGAVGRLAAVATVRIAHYGGGAGRKGRRHIAMFGRSAMQFYAKHGWKFL